MKYFIILTLLFLILYIVGFIKRPTSFNWMDRNFTTAIKGFSILTVVWAHAGARLSVVGIQFIAGIGVSLFLICSGYGLEMSYQKDGLKGFWKKRLLKICIPFWIVELVGLLITQQFEVKKYLFDVSFISPATGYGWFMQYIVICYVLFFGAKMISEKTKINDMWLLFAVFIVWFMVDSCFFVNPDMPFLRARQMFSFPLGMAIVKHKDKIETLIFKRNSTSRKRATALIIGEGMTGILFMAITQLSAVKALPYIVSNVLALFTVLPLAIAVIAFMNTVKVLLNNRLLLGAGTVSYEIYLIHAFTLRMVTESLFWIGMFIMMTVALAVVLNFITKKLGRTR